MQPGDGCSDETGKAVCLSVADGLVLVLAAIVALTYNRQLDPEPEKMLFGGQLVVLWFLLRFLLTGWPQLQLFFLAVVVATGGIEAVSGMRQLHGFEGSNHSLFKLTGDFYNPGPYSGYLAIILPVCLWMILRQTKIYLHYLGWIGLLAIIVVLPAGMSRTAWIAAAVSCGWVYWVQRIGWEKTKRYINGNRTLTIVSSILILISIAGALAGIYLLKKDSANGRLLLWKVTGQAIRNNPDRNRDGVVFRLLMQKHRRSISLRERLRRQRCWLPDVRNTDLMNSYKLVWNRGWWV